MEIDLRKIEKNYKKILDKMGRNVIPAAVLKSDAYGIGINEVSQIMLKCDCKNYFVTYIDEALVIKNNAEKIGKNDVNIFILSSCVTDKECEKMILEDDHLIPVLRTLHEIEFWVQTAKKISKKLNCVIKFDTGMNRFGLKEYEYDALKQLDVFKFLNVMYIMSHMSAANILDSELNKMQFEKMLTLKKMFPGIPVTFANSYSIFLDESFSFDMVRIGRLLYGETDEELNCQRYPENSLEEVISLKARIIQIKNVQKGEFIGYEGTFNADHDMKIAIVGIGYADGYPTSASNKGYFIINGEKAKIVGRIAMEYAACDISEIKNVHEGDFATVIGDGASLGRLAKITNTGSLELISNLMHAVKNKEYVI